MAWMTRISLEQKGTKATKEDYFFVAFVCFCGNRLPMKAPMENSSSVKSVKSVVQFLRLRPAGLGFLRILEANQSKWLSINHLRIKPSVSNRGQSRLIKLNQDKKNCVCLCMARNGRFTRSPGGIRVRGFRGRMTKNFTSLVRLPLASRVGRDSVEPKLDFSGNVTARQSLALPSWKRRGSTGVSPYRHGLFRG